MVERFTRKQTRSVRNRAKSIIKALRKGLKDKYIFDDRLVGSARWNIITKNKGDYWDLDYQFLLTKRSKKYKENKLSKPTEIKNDFFNCLNDKYNNDRNIKVENSTTAITFINKSEKYSIDFVIIKLLPENKEIIRRNIKKETITLNEYTWNELPKYNEAYNKFKKLTPKEKQDLIENYVLPRKIKEKSKGENDETKKSSSEVLVEEINNYVS